MLIRTIVLLFIILLEIKVLFSDNIIQLHCKNTMDGSKHIFEIYKNYKVVNILPNGYQFDYSIDYENKSEVKAYFIQKKNNFLKKFVLTFNINKNLIYDEMYEGTSVQNLYLKDKKIFTCNND